MRVKEGAIKNHDGITGKIGTCQIKQRCTQDTQPSKNPRLRVKLQEAKSRMHTLETFNYYPPPAPLNAQPQTI